MIFSKFLWRRIGLGAIVMVVFINESLAQNVEVYPSNWFVQMKSNKVQILFRTTSSHFSKATIQTNYPGLTISKVHHFENDHYMAVDVTIAPHAKVGKVNFIIESNGQKINTSWALLPRRAGRGTSFAQGINSADLIYFLCSESASEITGANIPIDGGWTAQ